MCIEWIEISKEFIKNQYPGIVTSLFVGWLLWRMQLRHDAKRSKATEEKQMLDLRSHVISDINYNITAGVGNAQCPFELAAIEKLAQQKAFNDEIVTLAQEIVVAARLCNAHGGVKNLDKPPGSVKELLKRLKALLQ
jgi:hypothetical protein